MKTATIDNINYRRLPGRARKTMGAFSGNKYRLWLADDHLLYVQSISVSLSYKRFYLSDIQAFVVSRTRANVIANIIIPIIFLTVILPVLLFASWQATAITATILGVILGPFLIVNLASGPTCKCVLHTAVQAEPIYCLGRLHTAQRVIDRLRPIIQAAQGAVVPETPDANTAPRTLRASTHVTRNPQEVETQQPIRHEHGTVHAWLFGLMLLSMLSSIFDMVSFSYIKSLFDFVVFISILIVAANALAKQKYSDLPPFIRNLTTASLVVEISGCLMGLLLSTFITFADVASAPTIETMLRMPAFMALIALSAIASGIIGSLGLSRLAAFRAAYTDALQAKTAASAEPAARPFSGREL